MTATEVAVLLGGSIGDLPLVRELRRAGRKVVTVGSDPSGPAHREADEHVLADFSDADACTVVARDRAADAVIPGSNDFAAITAAIVSERLRLPGNDPVQLVLDLNLKGRFRTLQSEIGIPHPGRREVGREESAADLVGSLRLPILVKPTDLTGGKGIGLVRDWSELPAALESARAVTRRDQILMEEYLAGSRHGVTSLIVDGRVDFHFFDDEQYAPGGYRVVGATSPSSLTEPQRTDVVRQLDAIAQHLRLSDGLLHAQLIAGPDGVVLVEATRRLPGDLYAMFVERACSYPYVSAVVAPYLGEAVPRAARWTEQRAVGRWVVVSDRAGSFRGLRVASSLAPAVLETHHAVDPDGGAVARGGQTLAVLIVDLDLVPPDAAPWDGGGGLVAATVVA